MSLKPHLESLVSEYQKHLHFTNLSLLAAILIAFAMTNIFTPFAWIILVIPLYIILSPRFSLAYKIVYVALFSFLAPTAATYWMIFFAKRIYLMSSLLFGLVFFLMLAVPALILNRYQSKTIKSAILLVWLIIYFQILFWLHIQYIIEFSTYVKLFAIAHHVGSMMLTIAVFFFNLLLAIGLVQKEKIQRVISWGIFSVLILSAYMTNSFYDSQQKPEQTFETIIVQGNFHKTWKWRTENIEDIYTYYENTTLAATESPTEKTRIVIWPEYALVGDIIHKHSTYLERLKNLAKLRNAYLIIGTIVHQDKSENYDSALIISPEGKLIDRYDSVYPVYFNKHTAKGTEFTTVDIGGKKIGFVICYEEMIPEVFDIYTEKQVDIIISLVNDMDLSGTPGMEFLLRYAQMRAAENKMMILRSANTGYSVVIDNYGQILSAADLDKQTWVKCTF